ncbi:jg16939 [Pararge aegeria aegeria]|uniref:Jg16939 protein n=1 Tax=Pararge aegeria aegeria TaxID=348720 RepID=A0A8S4SFU7_9NEOP|nr:jg16939 [Pararge aegeria aegeria]
MTVTKQKRWLTAPTRQVVTIILSVITLRRELGTLVSRRGDSKAVNTESQILHRIIYRQDFDLKMVQQDLT